MRPRVQAAFAFETLALMVRRPASSFETLSLMVRCPASSFETLASLAPQDEAGPRTTLAPQDEGSSC